MYSYLKGIITEINSNNIVLDVSGIGYLLNTPNPFSFNLDDEYKVYVYQVVREDELTLYGFKTIDEKELFLKLISVKGLGPKMALPIVATGSVSGISDAVERENILYLKKFPKIGDKLARQMILDLKGKLGDFKDSELINDSTDELYDALLGFGYKDKEIKGVISQVDKSLSLEDQIRDALKLFLK